MRMAAFSETPRDHCPATSRVLICSCGRGIQIDGRSAELNIAATR
jgi:hypothetical protein